MKRHFKQLLVAFLALTMVLTGAMCVQAKTITKPAQTLTLYPSKSLHYNANRRIFATANETVVNTDSYMNWGTSSFKSSKTSVVSLISRKVYMLTQTNPDSHSAYFMKAKKTGSAVVSYKKGKDTYKQKVTVKKYVNPLSSFKIGSMNLTSRFNKKSHYVLSYDKYKNKELKLQIKGKDRWNISTRKRNDPKGCELGTWLNDGDTFKVANKNMFLTVFAYDQKTKQTIECTIIFK